MRAGLAWIAAKPTVSAIISAKIGQGDENLARIGDDAGLEPLFGGASGSQQAGQVGVGAGNQAESPLPGNRNAGLNPIERTSRRRTALRGRVGGGSDCHLNRMIQRLGMVM